MAAVEGKYVVVKGDYASIEAVMVWLLIGVGMGH